MSSDPLRRFLDAQERTYADALAELARGEKRGHWMWFIFPQIAGLGHSPAARLYAIASLEEARAYLAHPVLGPRLRECVETLQSVHGKTAAEVFGDVDAMKLRSSLTLFTLAGDEPLFESALARWFDSADRRTVELASPLPMPGKPRR